MEKVHASLAHQVDELVYHGRGAFYESLDTVARNHSNARSLEGFCRSKVLSLAKATGYAEYGRRLKHCYGERSIAIGSKSANGALLQDKEHSASLLGLKKQMPSSTIQYVAVLLEGLQAGIWQMFEEIDFRKATYIEHPYRPPDGLGTTGAKPRWIGNAS
jgi:hypothetical protein